MIFCVNCGEQLPDDARFCPACGTPAVKPAGRASAAKAQPADAVSANSGQSAYISRPASAASAGSGQPVYAGGGFSGVQAHNDFGGTPANAKTVKIEMCSVNRILFKGNQRVTITFNGQLVWDGYVGNTADLDVAGRCEISVHYHMHANFYPGQMNCTIDPAECTYYQVVPRQSAFHLKLSLIPVSR